MNLAQLIDGDRVRSGLGRAERPRQRAALEPLGIVTHHCRDSNNKSDVAADAELRGKKGRPLGVAHDVRLALGAADRPLSIDEITSCVDEKFDINQVRAAATHLVHNGDLSTEGARGQLKYQLTAKGRAKL